MVEHFFSCPYCWERISMLLDDDMQDEVYIEDCEVCCRPIEVNFTLSGESVRNFNINKIEGNE